MNCSLLISFAMEQRYLLELVSRVVLYPLSLRIELYLFALEVDGAAGTTGKDHNYQNQ